MNCKSQVVNSQKNNASIKKYDYFINNNFDYNNDNDFQFFLIFIGALKSFIYK